jgi:hypothetical protein
MRVPSPMRIATLSLLVGGLACARNKANEEVGAARDTTALDTMARDTMARDTAGVPDSLKRIQSKSGVTDTLKEAMDSSAINRDPTSTTTRQTVVDSSMSPEKADSSAADSSTAR